MTKVDSKIMSVSALNHAIKLAIEPGFGEITVEGEVTNYRLQASGHEYFSLKDAKSQISCVFFKGFRAGSPIQIKPGDKVVIEGDISLYEPRGTYQIVVKRAKAAGVGDLLLKIHELKKELEALGWCDPFIKKALPHFPSRIGVVTSPSGSVIQDIIHVLNRRFSGFQLILNPVKVQGEGAAVEIAKAITEMNEYDLADIIIIGRGGGSLEDLMPFNERCVAEAIHKSHIPIISAVGHETDFSISDFVADVRAPTPSAAAEIAVKEKQALFEKLMFYGQSMLKLVHDSLRTNMQKLDDMNESLDSTIWQIVREKGIRLDGLRRQKEAANPIQKLKFHMERCQNFVKQLDYIIMSKLDREAKKLETMANLCNSINPKKLLKQGYCIPFAQNTDSVIISSKQVKSKDEIRLLLHDGQINTEVK
ncbi:MAG: exodeoxyribonuclease VII large subunit [Rhabdochlamydiaceae bacterium]|nr:exodeoxyribonuclease VII large subunit [Candidatus Amphrikana amoebophyrae]